MVVEYGSLIIEFYHEIMVEFNHAHLHHHRQFNQHHQQHDKCRLLRNHPYAYHHHRQQQQKHQRQQQPKLSRCVKSQMKQLLFNVFTCSI